MSIKHLQSYFSISADFSFILSITHRVTIEIPFFSAEKTRNSFRYFAEKNAHSAEFSVSRNSPFRGSERNEFREKMKVAGRDNIYTIRPFIHRSKKASCKHHLSFNALTNYLFRHQSKMSSYKILAIRSVKGICGRCL